MKRLTMIVVFLTLFVFAGQVFAQEKIRFVNTQKINENYAEAIALQKKLDNIYQGYQTEYEQMAMNFQQKQQDLENQSLLLSPEKKAEKQRELQEMYAQLENYKVQKIGPQGEMFQKQQELSKPVIEKIQQVIDKIAADNGYDTIMDIATAGLLYYNEKLDITDIILDELQKNK